MKENIETIPLIDAFKAEDECPFCFLERMAEQHALSFILGSAYMEEDIRTATDEVGFCRHHYKMMYDYGNRLGSALILETHLKKLNRDMAREIGAFTPGKSGLAARFKKGAPAGSAKTSLGVWTRKVGSSCYVCDHFEKIYQRYLDTFFHLYKKNEEFRELLAKSKGFCLPHFGDLVERAEDKLSDSQKKEFYPTLFSIMQKNLKRLEEEVSWFVMKNDYRHKDESWGTSADSVQRAMQKCAGGYPADPVFVQKR